MSAYEGLEDSQVEAVAEHDEAVFPSDLVIAGDAVDGHRQPRVRAVREGVSSQVPQVTAHGEGAVT